LHLQLQISEPRYLGCYLFNGLLARFPSGAWLFRCDLTIDMALLTELSRGWAGASPASVASPNCLDTSQAAEIAMGRRQMNRRDAMSAEITADAKTSALHCYRPNYSQAAMKLAGGGRACRKTERQKDEGQKNEVRPHSSVAYLSVCLSYSVAASPRCTAIVRIVRRLRGNLRGRRKT